MTRPAMQPSSKRTMDEYRIPRERMAEILRGKTGIKDERVLAAMASVPRHAFVPEALKAQAYRESALPIAAGQTISQPQIVARMSELLEVRRDSRLLEIGVGSGYQTAVLAHIAGKVFGVERVPELADGAQRRLRSLGYRNFRIKCDDGTVGWEEYAPFDGILVAAGGPDIPEPLLLQLKVGGRLVIPVGDDASSQRLLRITRTEETFKKKDFGPCTFVPLIGEHGWKA